MSMCEHVPFFIVVLLNFQQPIKENPLTASTTMKFKSPIPLLQVRLTFHLARFWWGAGNASFYNTGMACSTRHFIQTLSIHMRSELLNGFVFDLWMNMRQANNSSATVCVVTSWRHMKRKFRVINKKVKYEDKTIKSVINCCELHTTRILCEYNEIYIYLNWS